MQKVYNTGLIVARMQIITSGHEHLINTSLKMCEQVLLFVGSAQESGTFKNPFKVSTRINLIRELYPDESNLMIHGLSDLTSERKDTFTWGNYVLDNANRYLGEEPDCMVCGLCKEEQRRAIDWIDLDKVNNMNIVLVPTSTIPVRATYVREMMVLDNKEEWMKWVNPRIHEYYEILRQELMSISEYQKLEHELCSEKNF